MANSLIVTFRKAVVSDVKVELSFAGDQGVAVGVEVSCK